MAIDSAAKRRSIASLALPFLVAGITPGGSLDVYWRQTAAWSYSGINSTADPTPPTDDDGDTTVTSRVDKDGATVRPPRITVMHAAGGARNAELVSADRLPMDRYSARSVRSGRTPTASPDTRFRFKAWSARAGDSLAVREILLTLDVRSRPAVRLAKDTTSRTDKDGATLRVPEMELLYAASSALNADLRAGSTWRDRFSSRHELPNGIKTGYIHRFQLRGGGRAGDAGCPLEAIVRLVLSADATKAIARDT